MAKINTRNDAAALQAIRGGKLVVDVEAGMVWRRREGSNDLTRAERVTGKGYLCVGFAYRGQWVRVFAHRVIWLAAYGGIPCDLTINHKDGQKQNNRIENLELMTVSENLAHAYYVLGRHEVLVRRGEANQTSKLTDGQVAEMIDLRAGGWLLRDLAKRFGVDESRVSRICRGKRHE